MSNRVAFGRTLALVVGAMLLALLFVVAAPRDAFALDGEQYTVKVDTGFLALRTKPAYDDANVIDELYSGDTVLVQDRSRSDYWWVYAPRVDESGYVNKDYLVSATSYGDYTVKVDKGYLALRSAPAYDDKNVVGELYTGDVVTVKDMPSGQYWWVYSPKYDEYGYVDKGYLTTAPAPYGDYTVKVDKGYLALRSEPNYDDDCIIGELYTGDVVSVQEKRGGQYWWVYSPKYNKEGYVNSDYLVKR